MRGILPSIAMERVLLVVAKDFKYNGLGFDVFQEGSCHSHSDLFCTKITNDYTLRKNQIAIP